jgi:hypothetical protein
MGQRFGIGHVRLAAEPTAEFKAVQATLPPYPCPRAARAASVARETAGS